MSTFSSLRKLFPYSSEARSNLKTQLRSWQKKTLSYSETYERCLLQMTPGHQQIWDDCFYLNIRYFSKVSCESSMKALCLEVRLLSSTIYPPKTVRETLYEKGFIWIVMSLKFITLATFGQHLIKVSFNQDKHIFTSFWSTIKHTRADFYVRLHRAQFSQRCAVWGPISGR